MQKSRGFNGWAGQGHISFAQYRTFFKRKLDSFQRIRIIFSLGIGRIHKDIGTSVSALRPQALPAC